MVPATLNWIVAGLLGASVLVLAALLVFAARGQGLHSRIFDIALLGLGVGIVLALIFVLSQGRGFQGSP